MVFAASHPDRASALVLANTGARFLRSEDYPGGFTPEGADFFLRLVEEGWGTDGASATVSPSGAQDPRFRAWLAKMMRASGSPRAMAAQLRVMLNSDVRSVLPSIRVPTLVLHRQGLAAIPLEHGRYLAEHIPGARLVEIPGEDSVLFTSGGRPDPRCHRGVPHRRATGGARPRPGARDCAVQ
jgi:pimeloyl-ACP methyl ester carboxylesterase